MPFTIKTYSGKATKAHFFVQSHGENAGKPLKEAIANCFEITVIDTDVLLPEYLYYMFLAAFQAGAFKKYLTGTAVKFLTIENVKKAFLEYYGN